MDANAVNYLNSLKQRDSNKGLILVANSLELFKGYIRELTDDEREKILHTESPTSWIIAANKNMPSWLAGSRKTLAIRITQHPVISELCDRLQHPLVSSSANQSTKKPALNTLQLHSYFHGKLDSMLIADTKHSGTPSSIRVLENNLILRP
jgi:L-threonylcarbamoyladenylate synthase